MINISDSKITKEEEKEIKEFVSILFLLSKEDRAVLLSNASALRVRMDIQRKHDLPWQNYMPS